MGLPAHTLQHASLFPPNSSQGEDSITGARSGLVEGTWEAGWCVSLNSEERDGIGALCPSRGGHKASCPAPSDCTRGSTAPRLPAQTWSSKHSPSRGCAARFPRKGARRRGGSRRSHPLSRDDTWRLLLGDQRSPGLGCPESCSRDAAVGTGLASAGSPRSGERSQVRAPAPGRPCAQPGTGTFVSVGRKRRDRKSVV